MAIKRIFEKHNTKARTCLKCGAPIGDHILKDNKPYTCQSCGQVHFVDIYGHRVALTKKEAEEFRRRHKATMEEKRIAELEEQLAAAQKNAKEWEDAAEGLARCIEDMKEKEMAAGHGGGKK